MTVERNEELEVRDLDRRGEGAAGGAGAGRWRSGFSLVDQTKMVTAASELARNTLEHGGGGIGSGRSCCSENGRRGVRLVCRDEGPGIADIEHRAARRLHHRHRAGAGPGRRAAAGQRVRDRVAEGRGHDRDDHPMEVSGADSTAQALPVQDGTAIGSARRAAVALAEASGASEEVTARVALVATELATNLVRHGGGGTLIVQRAAAEAGLEMVALDRGPGISHLDEAVRDGFAPAGRRAPGSAP